MMEVFIDGDNSNIEEVQNNETAAVERAASE